MPTLDINGLMPIKGSIPEPENGISTCLCKKKVNVPNWSNGRVVLCPTCFHALTKAIFATYVCGTEENNAGIGQDIRTQSTD